MEHVYDTEDEGFYILYNHDLLSMATQEIKIKETNESTKNICDQDYFPVWYVFVRFKLWKSFALWKPWAREIKDEDFRIKTKTRGQVFFKKGRMMRALIRMTQALRFLKFHD